MKSVTGVKKRSVQSVSIKLTNANQKAKKTVRINATLPIMNIPQKSILVVLAERENYDIMYHPNAPMIAAVNAREN